MKSPLTRRLRRRIVSMLDQLARKIAPAPIPGQNLTGDRDIEWSWILSHMGNGPGKALDLGPGASLLLSVTAAQRGYEVLSLDREQHRYPYVPRGVTFKQGDITTEFLAADSFDLIICCSTIEHVGLTNRYGVGQSAPSGDLETMRKLYHATRSGGTMLLTLPVGVDAVFAPAHRVYGEIRLPELLENWLIQEDRYWVKTHDDQWVPVSRQEAIARPGSFLHYGLGSYVLVK